MKPVTDPALLEQLEGVEPQAVTDPAILAELEGAETPRGIMDFPDIPSGRLTDRPAPEGDFASEITEPIRTIGSAVLAEPVAGLAGLATLPFSGPEQARKNIESVREALTYIPRTPEGMAKLQEVAKVLEPVAKGIEAVEAGIGDPLYEATGSEILGAAGRAAPTAVLEAFGLGAMRRAGKPSKLAVELEKRRETKGAKKLLEEATPEVSGLKQSAREVYKEIDDLGVTVNPSSVSRLSGELRQLTREQGFNARIHPKVEAALKEFDTVAGRPQSTSELDTLRRVARGAAKSIEPDEARLGSMMIEKIDDFLDNLTPQDLSKPTKAIGSKYKEARSLWGRAKKTEVIEDAFEKAGRQATGFENGIRNQFRAILNNKKKSRGFSKDELDAMDKVVKGTTLQNTAKMLGRFGFSEGQASNMLMGSLGVAGGATAFGAPGAVAVPLIGQLSRGLAQRITKAGAEGVHLLTRAGGDGMEIAKAYMKIIKPGERNARELAELLLRPTVSLKKLNKAAKQIKKLDIPNKHLIEDAIFLSVAIKRSQETKEDDQTRD